MLKLLANPCQTLLALSVPLLCCLLLPGQARSDEILLHNGDRITGQILKKENGVVAVETSYGGTISIQWDQVAHISTDQPLEVYLKDKSLVKTTEIDAGQEERGDAIQASEILYINPPPYLTGAGVLWSGRLNAGFWAKDGNTQQKRFNFDGQVKARTEKERYTLAASHILVEDEGEKTEESTTGLAKVDHFFSKKWYGTAQVTGEKDRFKDIDLRLIAGLGVGYQFWESKNLNLAVESGFDYITTDYIEAPDEEYPAWRWALDFDKFLVKERLQAFHHHQLNVGLEDTEDLLFSSQTGLRMVVMANVNATAQINYDWDNQPAEDTQRGDTTYIFSVGYSW